MLLLATRIGKCSMDLRRSAPTTLVRCRNLGAQSPLVAIGELWLDGFSRSKVMMWALGRRSRDHEIILDGAGDTVQERSNPANATTRPRPLHVSTFLTEQTSANATPFDTHLFINGQVTEDQSASLLTAAANTCYANRILAVEVTSKCTGTARS